MDDIIGGVLDPFNLSGLRKTKTSEARKRYEEAQARYSELWYKAKAKGIPLELLGYKRPDAVLQGSGMGGKAPLPGLPFVPIIPQSGADPGVSNDEIKRLEDEFKELSDDLRDIEDMKHDNPPQDTGSGDFIEDRNGDPLTEDDAKVLEQNIEQRNVQPTQAENIKGLSNHVRYVLERMTAQQRSYLKMPKSVLISVWKGQPRLQQSVLDIFNRNGIRFRDRSVDKIVQDIGNLPGSYVATLSNEIIELMRTNATSRKLSTSIMRSLRLVDLENVVPESEDPGLMPISQAPNLETGIAMMVIKYGVDPRVARTFAQQIIDKFTFVTAEQIDERGSINGGRASTLYLMSTYLDELRTSLSQAFNTTNIDLTLLGNQILRGIFDTATNATQIGGRSMAENIDALRQAARELTTELPHPPVTPDKPAINDALEGRIPERDQPASGGLNTWWVPPEASSSSSNDNSDFPSVGSSPASSFNMSDLDWDEDALGLPEIQRLEEAKLRRGAEGNAVVINSPGVMANLLRRFGRRGVFLERKDWSARAPPPDDPDDPDDPRIDILVANPDRRARWSISRKNLIKALLALGVGTTTISLMLKSVSDNDKDNKQDGKKGGKNKNDTKKVPIIIEPPKEDGGEPNVIISKPRKLPIGGVITSPVYPNIPPKRIVDATPFEGGATRIPQSDQTRKLGLSKDVVGYNALVDKFNNAIESGDVDRINKIKLQLDETYRTIKTTIVSQKRPTSNADRAPGSVGGYRNVPATIEYDFPPVDAKLGDGANRIKLTPAMREQGLEKIVSVYNMYVDDFNKAVRAGDMEKQKMRLDQMENINKALSQTQTTPAQGIDSDKIDARYQKRKAEHNAALAELIAAEKAGASPEQLNELILKLARTSASLTKPALAEKDELNPKTYLTDIFREKFPDADNETELELFNQMQGREEQLSTYVPKTDDGLTINQQANKEYQDIVFGEMPPDLPKAEQYKWRIEQLDKLMSKYNFPSATVSDEDPDTIADDSIITQATDAEKQMEREEETKARAENFERPNMKIGGEALVLLTTDEEKKAEDKRWAEYSYVQRGFGNGRNNPLFLENLRAERRRFGPLQPPYRDHPQAPPPRRRVEDDTRFLNIYQYDTQFEDEYDNTSFPMFTQENVTSTRQDAFENDRSIFHPEHALRRFRSKPTRIQQIRPDGQRFVPYGYKYGEQDNTRNGAVGHSGVISDLTPYDNCWGFKENARLHPFEYQMAKKSHY